jgi:hypothetical protein
LSWFREYGIAIKQREQNKRKKNAKRWFLKSSKKNKLVFDQELENEKGIVLEAKCALSSEVVVKVRGTMWKCGLSYSLFVCKREREIDKLAIYPTSCIYFKKKY